MPTPINPELQQVLDDFKKNRLWGQVQLDFQRGALVVIRKQITIKTYEENNDERKFSR
jgi:hypothetical protein